MVGIKCQFGLGKDLTVAKKGRIDKLFETGINSTRSIIDNIPGIIHQNYTDTGTDILLILAVQHLDIREFFSARIVEIEARAEIEFRLELKQQIDFHLALQTFVGSGRGIHAVIVPDSPIGTGEREKIGRIIKP